jgi:hypothetical protein
MRPARRPESVGSSVGSAPSLDRISPTGLLPSHMSKISKPGPPSRPERLGPVGDSLRAFLQSPVGEMEANSDH